MSTASRGAEAILSRASSAGWWLQTPEEPAFLTFWKVEDDATIVRRALDAKRWVDKEQRQGRAPLTMAATTHDLATTKDGEERNQSHRHIMLELEPFRAGARRAR